MAIADLVVTREPLPKSQVGFTVEVPQAEVDRAFARVLGRLQQRVKVEGFRPGKAPRELVEARIGPDALREEAMEQLVNEVMQQVLEDQKVEAIDRPKVEVADFGRGRPARFQARVSVYPEVTLPDLDALTVEQPSREVTDQLVDQRVDELRDRLAEITPVERPVQVGDIVVADIDLAVDGADVEAERRRAQEIEVKEGVLRPELLAAVPGRSSGDVVEVEFELPEDHVDPELRSKTAHVRFTIQGVKEKSLPILDIETVKQLSDGKAETEEELRAVVREDLELASTRLGELAFEQAVVKAVVDGAAVEIPDSLVDHELAHDLERMEEALRQQGLRLDRYFEYLQKTPEQWLAEQRPEAEARVRVDLVLEAAGNQLGVEPGEEDLMAYMQSQAARDPDLKDRYLELVASRSARDFFRHRLRRLQLLQRLVEKAGGTPVPAFETAQPQAVEAGQEA